MARTNCLNRFHFKYFGSILSEPRDCCNENYGEDLFVLASAAKSGAVLAAKKSDEMSRCGVCIASPERRVKFEDFHKTLTVPFLLFRMCMVSEKKLVCSLGNSADSTRMSKSQRNANPHLISIKFSYQFSKK